MTPEAIALCVLIASTAHDSRAAALSHDSMQERLLVAQQQLSVDRELARYITKEAYEAKGTASQFKKKFLDKCVRIQSGR